MKPDQSSDSAATLTRKKYEKELRKLQAKLCDLASLGQAQRPARHDRLRGPRRRRQGRYHSCSNRACQSPYFPCHRAARALRQREVAVVPPTLHAAFSCSGRDRDFRPQLVQPRGCRICDGLLHEGRAHPLSGTLPSDGEKHHGRRYPTYQNLAGGQRQRAETSLRGTHR